MTERNDGGPAFPRPSTQNPYGPDGPPDWGNVGMSLRDWFAGMALSCLMHSHDGACFTHDQLAGRAYSMADAMLAERDK